MYSVMTEQLLLERVVQPVGPVLDWRTHVSGCTEERARAVGVAPDEARLAVAQLVGPHTIIVGHAVRMVIRSNTFTSENYHELATCTPRHSTISLVYYFLACISYMNVTSYLVLVSRLFA